MTEAYEAEAAVIGGIVTDSERAADALNGLSPDMFSDALLGTLFAEAQQLHRQGKPIDPVTLIGADDNQDRKMAVVRCAEQCVSMANYGTYVGMVRELWRQRTIAKTLQAAAWEVPGIGADRTVDKLRHIVAEQDAIAKAGNDSVEYLEAAANWVNWMYADKSSICRSGYRSIDDAIGGIALQTVTAIAARPGQGKTAFALNLMMRMAKRGARVLYCTLEMPARQLMSRVAAMLTKIDASRIRDRNLTPEELQSAINAVGAVEGKLGIRFVETQAGIDDLRRLVDQHKPDVVIIDHLGLMKVNRYAKRYEAVGELSRQIHAMAVEKKVAVIELVQMNRETEKRKDRKPILSDLRESGDIEQDCDNVLFLQSERPEDGRPVTGNGYIDTKVYVEKAREGRISTIPLHWQPQYHLFTETEFRFG